MTPFLPAGMYRTCSSSGDEVVTEVAIKILKSGLSLESQTDFEREIEILSGFNHPNIIKLLGIFQSQGSLIFTPVYSYESNSSYSNFSMTKVNALGVNSVHSLLWIACNAV